LLVSNSKLAEYSFAYKIFEVTTLPLMIVAPLMIPLFTRLLKDPRNMVNLSFFLQWQIIIASFVALMLNICWIPFIDFISDGKYGKVNSGTVLILSLSMPLLYFSNYLWTIQFAKGNLRLVFKVMAVSFAVNITCCSILIPLYNNEGAAIAYLMTVLVQLIFYLQKKTLNVPGTMGYHLWVWPVTALFCGFFALRFTTHTVTGILFAIISYFAVVFVSKQVRIKDWKTLQSLYH
jgi:O-antigen/teichoic acid export membrane protein